jgi:hypothetical protein
MRQQPDDIFRKKLHDYQKPAPPSGWDRIEESLAVKKTPFLRIAVAASLLIGTAISAMVFLQNNGPDRLTDNSAPSSQPRVSNEGVRSHPDHLKRGVQESESPHAQVAPTEIREAKEKASDKAPRNEKHDIRARRYDAASKLAILEPGTETQLPNHHNDSRGDNADAVPGDPATSRIYAATENIEVQNTRPVKAETSVVIVMSVQETNGYFLKNADTEATSYEKKSSTLKKVLNKAKDLKNDQDPFGDLRQMKNEILALNFKNDKQRGQK